MTQQIVTSLPNNVRRPGAFSTIKWQNALTTALNELRAVIVAEKSAAATATADTPIQIFSEDDADTKLGMGSFAALGCKAAFAQAKLMGDAAPEVWCAPLTEPVGGAKATLTLTVTVTTAQQGDLKFRIAGRPLVVPVNAGDSANTIATAITAAIASAQRTLPGTATTTTNVSTFVVATKGVNGNDVVADVVSQPTGVTLAIAVGTPGTGAAVITTAIQALYDQRYHAVCIGNHTTTDIATLVLERAAAWGFNQQNYRFFFMGERGSLGTAQTLEAAANDFGIIIGTYEGTPSLPIEIAVCDAFAEFASTRPNVNMDGQRVALYPPTASLVYTTTEIESALNGGLTPHVPDGSYSKIVRMMTSEITLDGVNTEVLRDISYPRTAAYRAELHETNFRQQFKQENVTDETLPRVRDMQIGIDRSLASQSPPILRDVESRLSEYVVALHPSVAGRVQSSSPFTPAGALHQLDSVHVMYL
jgi:phage tail sheath gpL-like